MGNFAKIVTMFLSLVLVITVGTSLAQETGENFVVEPFGSVLTARGITLDPAGDLLVVSRVRSTVNALFEVNGTVSSVIVVNRLPLKFTHGIVYKDGFLYCSSQSSVFRWPYSPGQRDLVDVDREQVIIKDIPDLAPEHNTRTMIFDNLGLLYVTIGARGNIDQDSSEARLIRFNISSIPDGGISFSQGEIFADGVRNQVGLALDMNGVFWGVDNGADELFREDLGGDIHNTNPADEMTKFDQPPGTFYGYPYCWTVDQLEGHQSGEQLVWPDFMNDTVHSDTWCKNRNNTLPPTLPLPAHFAALGITFYDGTACNTSEGAFPCHMKGDAFVAFHGSWNREPQDGYKVVRIPIDQQTGLPTGVMENVVFDADPVNCRRCFRPVDLVFDRNGHLLVSSDNPGDIIRVKWDSGSNE